jgi:AcrR family transcriptional regulator
MHLVGRVLSLPVALILLFASAFAEPREVGRPRMFPDEEIFLATARAVARHGYARLTLDEIASELGCTRQALARRFGSKHDLVRAYLHWVLDQGAIRYQQIRMEYSSPLAALRARLLFPADEQPGKIADPASQANIFSFFIGASETPEFRALLERQLQAYEAEVTCLLSEARIAGELELTDARELARTLIAATTGEISLWAPIRRGPVAPRLAQVIDAVLKPYRVSNH